MTRGEFARAILLAHRLREDTFDIETNTFGLTFRDAARRALLTDAHSEDWSVPVSLLLALAWRHIEVWAVAHKNGVGKKSVRTSYQPNKRPTKK